MPLLLSRSGGAGDGDGGGEENKSDIRVVGDCGGNISSGSCESCISNKMCDVSVGDAV